MLEPLKTRTLEHLKPFNLMDCEFTFGTLDWCLFSSKEAKREVNQVLELEIPISFWWCLNINPGLFSN